MLYSYELLCKKPRGMFAQIWLLANDIKVTDRKIKEISISETVKELQVMITQQNISRFQETSAPRLSMYVSAKLCYGTVLAHSRQLDLLISQLTKSSFQLVQSPLPKQKRLRTKKRTVSQATQRGGQTVQETSEGVMLSERIRRSIVDEMFVTDLKIDIIEHIEVFGAPLRADERNITLIDEIGMSMVDQPQLDQGFGEIPVTVENRILFGEEQGEPVPQLREPENQDVPEIHVQAPEEILGEITVPPPPQTPIISPARPSPGRPVAVAVQLVEPSPQIPEPLPIVQSPAPQPILHEAPLETVGLPQSPIGIRPIPRPRISGDLVLEDIDADVLDARARRTTTRTRKRRRRILIDQVNRIPDLQFRMQFSSGDTLRVQVPRDDRVNVTMNRYIIPGKQLLESVRHNIRSQHLISRHFVTRGVSDEIETTQADLTKATEPSQSIVSDVTVHIGPEEHPQTIQEESLAMMEAEVQLPVQQTEHEPSVETEAVAHLPSPEEQPLEQEPEGRTDDEPQEQEQRETRVDDRDVEKALSPSRFDVAAAMTHVIDVLENLPEAGSQVRFDVLCPPSKTDRVTAMRMFEALLELDEMNKVTISQSLDTCPPVFPHPSIYIRPQEDVI